MVMTTSQWCLEVVWSRHVPSKLSSGFLHYHQVENAFFESLDWNSQSKLYREEK